MARVNLFAYTAPGVNYPEYLSINESPEGGVEVIVRSKANPDGSCGVTAQITLPVEIPLPLFDKK